jgi:hypothetical protein
LLAEQKTPPKSVKAAPKLKPMSPESEKAAYELFKSLRMKEGIAAALNQSLEVQVKRQPAMAPYKKIYQDFFAKYTRWDDMKKELARLYSQVFTAEEMKQLSRFYSSKLGQKSLGTLPKLTQLSMILAQKRIAAHSAELKKAVGKKAKELEAAAKKSKK